MIHVPPEELAAQQQVSTKIKASHGGKTPLACVITLGCVQNENDSQRLQGMLVEMGYQMCHDTKEADLVLFNTCAVRENAEKKLFGYIGALKMEKELRPHLLIGICGCMMQQPHIIDRIRQTYRQVDMVFGTHSLHRFPQILFRAMQQQRVEDVEDVDGYIAEGLPQLRSSTVSATVSVMFGCDNFCTYCIVPYVRGRERSRNHKDILAEVTGLAAQGCKEVTLLGQNVNSYGNDCKEMDFADLLTLVSQVEGIERIRFVSSHPKDVTDKLIQVIATNPKVCNQLHIPVQAGSTKVLADMNRHYTKEQYLDLVERIRSSIPDIAITGDIMVGFPTETNEDFAHTMDLVEKVGYDMLYTFIYSKRKGTPAEKIPFALEQAQIKENFEALVALQTKILGEKNKQLEGSVMTVLVEGTSKTDSNILTGRTESGKVANFEGDPVRIGTFVQVKIKRSATWALTGEIIS